DKSVYILLSCVKALSVPKAPSSHSVTYKLMPSRRATAPFFGPSGPPICCRVPLGLCLSAQMVQAGSWQSREKTETLLTLSSLSFYLVFWVCDEIASPSYD